MIHAFPPPHAPVRRLSAASRATERTVPASASLVSVIEAFQRHPEHRSLYVVDAERSLVGTITLHDLRRAVNARYGVRAPGVLGFARQMRDLHRDTAQEIMRPAFAVRPDAPLREALFLLHSAGLDALPVTDAKGRIVGEITAEDYLELALDVAMATTPSTHGRG